MPRANCCRGGVRRSKRCAIWATPPDWPRPANWRAERLPQSIRDLVEQESTTAIQLAVQVQLLDGQHLGLALDTLYELATPATVGAVREVLSKTTFDREHLWRATKSIYKRALLRQDFVTFGWLSHAIEARGRASKGSVATVKSGLDGATRKTRIFGRNTQNFLRRLAWRYLRYPAHYRPEEYAAAAAEAIIHYTPQETGNRNRNRFWRPLSPPSDIVGSERSVSLRWAGNEIPRPC